MYCGDDVVYNLGQGVFSCSPAHNTAAAITMWECLRISLNLNLNLEFVWVFGLYVNLNLFFQLKCNENSINIKYSSCSCEWVNQILTKWTKWSRHVRKVYKMFHLNQQWNISNIVRIDSRFWFNFRYTNSYWSFWKWFSVFFGSLNSDESLDILNNIEGCFRFL